MRSTLRGVTLIELLITVALIAILTAIAMPGYRRYVQRAHRGEAMRALLRLQTAQEAFFLQNNAYASDLAGTPPGGLGQLTTTESGMYRIAFSASTTTTYRATATAIAGQQDDHDCAVFAISENGVREAANQEGGDTREACWR